MRPPRICGCGLRIASGEQCPCERRRSQERKARHDQHRPTARQRGYNTAWDRTREAFLQAHPFCHFCNATATVVDHKVPHRGDPALFWSKGNWQPLCASCHSGAKQSAEKRGRV